MTQPFLAIATTTEDGRGYRAIFEPENDKGIKPIKPSITTVLKEIAVPGLTQWAVDLTCAYYAANPDATYSRSAEAAYHMGRWYWNRTPDFDSPEYEPFNYHRGVLQDAADQGNFIHEYIEARFLDMFEPTPQNFAHEQMIEAFERWYADNDVKPTLVECTVYGEGYAGTFDWIGEVNGKKFRVDNKTSRAVRDSHVAQLGAVGAAHTVAIEVAEGTENAVSHTKDGETRWFIPEPLPAFEGYAVLQIRPEDVSKDGEIVDAFCELHEVPNAAVDAGYEMFRGALAIRQARKAMKEGGFEG